MPEIKSIHTSEIKFIDESFDLKESGTYHLSILTNERSLSFAVLDTNTNKYLVLQHTSDLKNKDILAPFTGISFKSISCAIAHNKFTLVPTALFDEETKNSLLGFNHPIEKEEKIHSDKLQNLEARNLFTIPKGIESLIRKHFTNTHFIHSATSFIEGLLVQNKNNAGKKVFSNFHSSYFEIVILDGREVLFSNAFKYKTPEDIAYYILFVYEQLHLNPEEIELTLSGAIEKTATEHALLFNYIRHVKFAARPDNFQYSYKLEEIPSHKFWNLFTQYLCV